MACGGLLRWDKGQGGLLRWSFRKGAPWCGWRGYLVCVCLVADSDKDDVETIFTVHEDLELVRIIGVRESVEQG